MDKKTLPTTRRALLKISIVLFLFSIVFVIMFALAWYLLLRKTTSFYGHSKNITTLVFSPDGKYLVSGSADGTVKRWDMTQRGNEKTIYSCNGRIASLAISPDGQSLAIATDETEIVVRGSGGDAIVRKVKGDSHQARIIDLVSSKTIKKFGDHPCQVTHVTFAVEGGYFVTGGAEGMLGIWNVNNDTKLINIDPPNNDDRACICYHDWFSVSPDRRFVVTSIRHDLFVNELSTGVQKCRIAAHSGNITSVAFSPNSALIVSSSYDGTAVIWDALTGEKLTSLVCGQQHAASTKFSPDGKVIALTSMNKQVPFVPAPIQEMSRLAFFDAQTGNELERHDAHVNGYVCIAFSPDGETLATGGADGIIRLWQVPSMK